MVNVNGNIFLIGFMGAGKSTVGIRLAQQLGCEFTDLDQLIVAREGMSIAAVFAARGEFYFRDCESAVLAEWTHAKQTVVATGGGIVGRAGNRTFMKTNGQVVYLRASWPTLEQRLAMGRGRPLADPQRGLDEVRKLWETRLPWYEEADLIVDTDDVSVNAVVKEIISRLGLEVMK
jgi:shikimate kinase